MEGLVGLLPIVGIALLFWLLIIRPASKRQRQQQQLQSSVSVGDRVMLTAGFFGTVAAVHDDRLEVELAPGTVVTVVRGAIGSIVREPAADDEPADDYDDYDEVEEDQAEPADETDVETDLETDSRRADEPGER